MFSARGLKHAPNNRPFDTRSQGLDLVDAWATDFLKILGKLGRKLNTTPDAIFQQIAPFCPRNSMIYQQFERTNAKPYHLSVEGISRTEWDDSLARLSFGADAQAVIVTCSGDHIAVMSAAGNVVLYDHDTFEIKRRLRPGERGAVMCFSSCSQLIAVYGFKRTRVWSADTGKLLHQIVNPLGRALSMTFSTGRTELLIGCNDRVIRKARLTDPHPTWSIVNADLLKDTNTLGKAAQNVPWAIVFSPHANHVAVSYRGYPLSVFRINPPIFIRKFAQNEHDWPIVQQVNWHSGTEDMVNDVAFSPNGKRLYDCRGQFCNVWEPNVLLRDEQAGDTESESASVSAVSQAVVEQRDHISAIGFHSGAYQAIGTHAGVVSVVDTQASDIVAVKLWNSRILIKHLDWSGNEEYLACAEVSGKVHVHRVNVDDGNWTATSVFSIYMRPGGIQKILMNDDGSYLFVKNGLEATVFQVETRSRSTYNSSVDAAWIRHPTNPKLPLASTPGHVQINQWENLEEIASFNFEYQPMPLPSPDSEQTFDLRTIAKVDSVLPAADRRQILVDLIITTGDKESHRTIIIDTPQTTTEGINRSSTSLTTLEIPVIVQEQIQTPLGILSNQRFMFIDKIDWVCSYSLAAKSTGHPIAQHYFFPKDWVTTECLQLCTLLADGRLLLPNNGELAVIKCETVW